MTRRILLVGILVCLFGLALTAAADPGPTEQQQSQQVTARNSKIMDQNHRTLQALEHAIDLWHDANLKNDEMTARQYMTQIRVIIDADLNYSQKLMEQAQHAKAASDQEQADSQTSGYSSPEDQAKAEANRVDYYRVKDLFQAKKRLYSSINRGASFANRFRLLNDYLCVVERQINETHIELAEGSGEQHDE